MTVVDPVRDEKGWRFFEDEPDPINGFEYVGDAYRLTDPDFSGRVTVPLLWDKQTNQAVNNESSEIIRMLNSEFNQWAKNPDLDYRADGPGSRPRQRPRPKPPLTASHPVCAE